MTATRVTNGPLHPLPADMRRYIASHKAMHALWEDITPLARNEWICWVISSKQEGTRGVRLEKMRSKMAGGMRRPCCWIGCVHRKDKPISASVRWVLERRATKKRNAKKA
jgi:hypothetical protein